MASRLIQRLLVSALVAVFGVVLPVHASSHAAEISHAAGHHDHEGDSPDSPAETGDHPCVVCRIAQDLSGEASTTLALTFHSPAHHPLPIDADRPAAVHLAIPFDGRAPPAA